MTGSFREKVQEMFQNGINRVSAVLDKIKNVNGSSIMSYVTSFIDYIKSKFFEKMSMFTDKSIETHDGVKKEQSSEADSQEAKKDHQNSVLGNLSQVIGFIDQNVTQLYNSWKKRNKQ